MAGDGAIQAVRPDTAQRGAKAPREAAIPKPTRGRVNMEGLLGAELVHSLRVRVAAVDSITAERVRAIDEEFQITRSYGVPRRRLKSLLQRLAQRADGRPDGLRTSASGVNRADWRKRLGRHRRRQASVASILDSLFGRLADCDPELWERRAYLMVIGMVYERLATSEKDLSDESLLKLARALAQQRRGGSAAIKRTRSDPREGEAAADSTDGRMPERFARLIRQVYGTETLVECQRSQTEDPRSKIKTTMLE